MEHINWNGFTGGVWQDEINVRNFIHLNYREYTGDERFLAPATPRTQALMKRVALEYDTDAAFFDRYGWRAL